MHRKCVILVIRDIEILVYHLVLTFDGCAIFPWVGSR